MMQFRAGSAQLFIIIVSCQFVQKWNIEHFCVIFFENVENDGVCTTFVLVLTNVTRNAGRALPLSEGCFKNSKLAGWVITTIQIVQGSPKTRNFLHSMPQIMFPFIFLKNLIVRKRGKLKTIP